MGLATKEDQAKSGGSVTVESPMGATFYGFLGANF
jgi:hypothetical protein